MISYTNVVFIASLLLPPLEGAAIQICCLGTFTELIFFGTTFRDHLTAYSEKEATFVSL